MKKFLLPFLAAVLLAAGCDSGSDDNGGIVTPPPAYKDNITLIEPYLFVWKEAELTKTAIILADGDDSRAQKITYGLQNETNNTYSNITFSANPAADSKYTLTNNIGEQSLSYGGVALPAVTITVTPHELGSINFDLTMNSDGHQPIVWPISVRAMYLLQPAYKDASNKMTPVTGTMDITEKGYAKFYVFNSSSTSTAIAGLDFENGTEGFTINTSEPTDAEGYHNCYAGGSLAVINSQDACFLLIEFNNPTAGIHTDTINIKNRNTHYKNSSITLSATVQ